MDLSFYPALGTSTRLAIPPHSPAAHELTFKAVFASPFAHDQARRNRVRVEIWSDLPVPGRAPGEWSALPFQPHSDVRKCTESSSSQTISLLPIGESDSAREEQDAHALYARFSLACPGTEPLRFSYTYRLVYPSGEIKWLGEYGKNGTLIIERKFPGFKPSGKWRARDNGASVISGGLGESEVGSLSADIEWSSWAIGADRSVHTQLNTR